MIGALGEGGDGAAHAFSGGLEDVESVDLLGLDLDDGVEDVGVLGDLVEEMFSDFGGQGFGVGEDRAVVGLGEDDGGDEEGACERASSGFIDACDPAGAVLAALVFEQEGAGGGRHGWGGGSWGGMVWARKRAKTVEIFARS